MTSLIEKARALRVILERLSSYLTDSEALDAIEFFPHWSGNGVEYTPEISRVSYNGSLYKCIGSENHISQPSWNPADAHSLWMKIDDPNIEWPEWEQRTGLEAYRIGAKVSYNGKHWINTFDYNAYEPGVYGWDEVS